MITCERCNTENLDGSLFCDECGAPISNKPPRSVVEPAPVESPAVESAPAPDPEPPVHVHEVVEVVAAHTQPLSSLAIAETEAVSEDAHANLEIERGPSTGKQFPLTAADSQIGRWDADDPEAKVSRRHARILFTNGRYFLEDLGSTNGTFVNRGKRLSPGTPHPLRDGDEIIVGKTFLRFHILN